MKRSPREIAASRKSTVVLNSTALLCVRGGLVSNFNRATTASDYNPDVVVVTNSGPIGMW
jgi:hypothetical protein